MPPSGPFQRLPALVVALTLAILAIEAALQLGAHGLIGGPQAAGWRLAAMTRFGFSAPLFDYMVETREPTADGLLRFVSYPAVHSGAMHAIFGAVLLAALGKAVSERFSQAAMAGILLAGAVAGALAYGFLLDSRVLLVGVYPAVYALIGAFSWWLFTMPESEARGRIAAFRLIGMLAGLQLLFRLLIGGGDEWVAHLAGFAAGFALAPLLAPDGGARLRRWRDRARQR
ncbi:MAG: rhomboid family intramembrane serine protease [Rhodovulum sp.]|nr:rhomboid family intramembrane serine protease [Paracoccaceae bacterium]MCC0067037.1 rhomboid family intramembrane serine protease [Rhodovulum sp.]